MYELTETVTSQILEIDDSRKKPKFTEYEKFLIQESLF